jgi:hypothetical protein
LFIKGRSFDLAHGRPALSIEIKELLVNTGAALLLESYRLGAHYTDQAKKQALFFAGGVCRHAGAGLFPLAFLHSPGLRRSPKVIITG